MRAGKEWLKNILRSKGKEEEEFYKLVCVLIMIMYMEKEKNGLQN